MSNSAVCSYVSPSSGSDVVDLQVLCLNGEGCTLKVSGSSVGWEVRRMVSNELPPRKGGKLTLQNNNSQLVLNQTLRQQGIEGNTATLSCTYVPTDYMQLHGVLSEGNVQFQRHCGTLAPSPAKP